MSGSLDKVRIAVLGDSGVGKTTLVHALAHGEVLSSSPWTIGCSVEVLLYDYQQAGSQEKSIYIELWDVGGSTSHKNSRSIFYNNVNGVILVHDLSNKKSINNLRKWFRELLNSGKQDFTGVSIRSAQSTDYNGTIDYDLEQFSGNNLPVLVVGTKLDQAPEQRASASYCSLAGELRATQINLDCLQKKSFATESQNWDKFCSFFDKVIDRKFAGRQQPSSLQTSFDTDSPRGSTTDKRRKNLIGSS